MPGCSMIVYDARLSRAIIALTSGLQPYQPRHHRYRAGGLLLTSGDKMLVCVDRGRVIIWRLHSSDKLTGSDKYRDDNAPADDAECDVDSYLYDDTADDFLQVTSSCMRPRGSA